MGKWDIFRNVIFKAHPHHSAQLSHRVRLSHRATTYRPSNASN
jgi:hypothetical protein